jgi:hypothetical protein
MDSADDEAVTEKIREKKNGLIRVANHTNHLP